METEDNNNHNHRDEEYITSVIHLVNWLAYNLEDIRFLTPNTNLAGKESTGYTIDKKNVNKTNFLLLKCKDEDGANEIQKGLAKASRLRLEMALDNVNEVLDDVLSKDHVSEITQAILLDIRKDFYNKQGHFQDLENIDEKPKQEEQ